MLKEASSLFVFRFQIKHFFYLSKEMDENFCGLFSGPEREARGPNNCSPTIGFAFWKGRNLGFSSLLFPKNTFSLCYHDLKLIFFPVKFNRFRPILHQFSKKLLSISSFSMIKSMYAPISSS